MTTKKLFSFLLLHFSFLLAVTFFPCTAFAAKEQTTSVSSATPNSPNTPNEFGNSPSEPNNPNNANQPNAPNTSNEADNKGNVPNAQNSPNTPNQENLPGEPNPGNTENASQNIPNTPNQPNQGNIPNTSNEPNRPNEKTGQNTISANTDMPPFIGSEKSQNTADAKHAHTAPVYQADTSADNTWDILIPFTGIIILLCVLIFYPKYKRRKDAQQSSKES